MKFNRSHTDTAGNVGINSLMRPLNTEASGRRAFKLKKYPRDGFTRPGDLRANNRVAGPLHLRSILLISSVPYVYQVPLPFINSLTTVL